MKKTVCELFAGVGGFRCGLNHIDKIEDTKKTEKWETVWFNQWEPADKKIQWAHGCYINRFGSCLDTEGNDTTNIDIHEIDKQKIPDSTLLVAGFPCQDYSIASTLATSKGLEGKKGVLWWDIRDILEAKQPPFVLLENVDRLLKSPAKQRGRDFAVILACFRDLGYAVSWRVINAAEYGYQQRRRRVFIFACHESTNYYKNLDKNPYKIIEQNGFFPKTFPVKENFSSAKSTVLFEFIGDISDTFQFDFQNAGFMINSHIFTEKTFPDYKGRQITLGDILEDGEIEESFFIPQKRLYYTSPNINHSNEIEEKLPLSVHRTWQYIKGAKKFLRRAKNGHEYIYSEGPVPMIDEYEKPARTMLTSEGSFSRTTHIVRDKLTGRIRLLTPIEGERIQGFPDNWTKECLVKGKITEMPVNKRRFMMGNALVVDLIKQMEPELSKIIEAEN